MWLKFVINNFSLIVYPQLTLSHSLSSTSFLLTWHLTLLSSVSTSTHSSWRPSPPSWARVIWIGPKSLSPT